MPAERHEFRQQVVASGHEYRPSVLHQVGIIPHARLRTGKSLVLSASAKIAAGSVSRMNDTPRSQVFGQVAAQLHVDDRNPFEHEAAGPVLPDTVRRFVVGDLQAVLVGPGTRRWSRKRRAGPPTACCAAPRKHCLIPTGDVRPLSADTDLYISVGIPAPPHRKGCGRKPSNVSGSSRAVLPVPRGGTHASMMAWRKRAVSAA